MTYLARIIRLPGAGEQVWAGYLEAVGGVDLLLWFLML